MQFPHKRSTVSVSKVQYALGSLALGVTIWMHGLRLSADLETAAYLLLVGIIVRILVRPLEQPVRQLFAAAYQQGLDQAWSEGHRSGRPTVVSLRILDDASGLLEHSTHADPVTSPDGRTAA